MKEYNEFKKFFQVWEKNKCVIHYGRNTFIPGNLSRIGVLEIIHDCYELKRDRINIVFSFTYPPRISFGGLVRPFIYRNRKEEEFGKKILLIIYKLMPTFDSFSEEYITNCLVPILYYTISDFPVEIIDIVCSYVCLKKDIYVE